jgi:hypothetical protein
LWNYQSINPSYNWIKNQEEQAVYPRYFGNQTWQKAIWDYVNGDKKSAFLALGHILHNLEDASVPEHTRNDTHVNELGDGSPYENFSHQYTLSKNNNLDTAETLIKENKTPLIYETPEQYFYNLAKYTNENFFSKDTIEKYQAPKWNFKKMKDNNSYYYYALNKDGNPYPLILFDKINNLHNFDDNILFSYFSRLSQQSVLYGAGLLNLFFQEIEKAKQNPELAEKPLESTISVISPFGEYAKFKNLANNFFNQLKNASAYLTAGPSSEYRIRYHLKISS